MSIHNKDKAKADSIRTIRTARTEHTINEAARNGFFPLVKKVEASPKIKSKYTVIQNKKSGEIRVSSDYRDSECFSSGNDGDFKTVIGFEFYYPYHFASPFAAYLIPKDLKIGERVFLEDVIEDVVSSMWNQGDTYRLKSCKAIWNGKEFELDHDLNISEPNLIG